MAGRGHAPSSVLHELRPGRYTFRVIACNNNGVWNEAGAFLDFSIAPAYYQTSWFRCVRGRLSGIALGALSAAPPATDAGIQRDLGSARRASGRASRGNCTILCCRVFTDCCCAFKRFQPTSGASGGSQEKLDSAIDQAAQAITEGRDAVQGLRSSTVETNDLALAIRTLGEELAADETDTNLLPSFRWRWKARRGTSIRSSGTKSTGLRARPCATPSGTPRRGRSKWKSAMTNRQLRLRVRDDGKGIDPKVLNGDGRAGHFGLPGMRERAKLVGGKLTVWSELDSGTEVELSIPASCLREISCSPRSWLSEKILRERNCDRTETEMKS